MKKNILVFVASGILGMVQAQEWQPYYSLGVGPMWTADADVSGGPYPAGSKIVFDPGFTVSTSVGARHGRLPLRAEFEYDFVKYYSDEANFAGFSDGNKLVWHVYMVNVYYEFGTERPVQPFVIAGLGYADVDSATSDVVAYQLGGGLEFELSDSCSMEIRYRYFTVADPELESNAGNYRAEFASQQLMFGLHCNF